MSKKSDSLNLKKRSNSREYELLVLLIDEFNEKTLKAWVCYYAKHLRKFSVKDISVVSRGRHKLPYFITYKSRALYLQFNFFSAPKYITSLLQFLKMDTNVLRFLIFNKNYDKKKV